MPRFFIDPAAIDGEHVAFRGMQATHLARSLRARPGEHVVASDGTTEYVVVIESVTPQLVTGIVSSSRPATGDPRVRIDVLQAVPARGMDDTVEALVVGGAASIRPVVTERSTARPGPERIAARLERWRSIAREAAQLAGRARPPEVHEIAPLAEALDALRRDCRILACVLDATDALNAATFPVDDQLAVVIGPEGGLAPDEQRLLRAHDAEFVHMGARAFPARLAGFAAVTMILARAGDLDVSPRA